MSIAYVSGAATVTPGNNMPVAATAPSSIAAGNLLVAIVMGAQGSTTITAPAGWTQAAQENVISGPGSSPGSCAVFTKTATGSEPATYTFSETGSSSSYLDAAILQYSGVSGLDGTPAFNTVTTAATASTAPSMTPSGATDTWVTAFCGYLGNSFTTPAGMAARVNATLASVVSVYTFDEQLSSSAPTGAAASTQSASSQYVGVSLLLAPAAATLSDSAGTVLVG
jgi:hypothetical protein